VSGAVAAKTKASGPAVLKSFVFIFVSHIKNGAADCILAEAETSRHD
jgi:hypothetical protein